MRVFKNRKEIESLLMQADDSDATKSLIYALEKTLKHRQPPFLTGEDLELILRWKLRSQYGRQKHLRIKNNDELIGLVTRTAFQLSHPDKDVETHLRLKCLSLLFGVDTAVASSILTLCYPHEYAVIDFRNWRQLYKETKTSYSGKEYTTYLKTLKLLASQFSFTVQEIDQAIWQKDINENG